MEKNLPANAGDARHSVPGWEHPLEQEAAAHSGILAGKVPWTDEPAGLQFMGLQRAGHD